LLNTAKYCRGLDDLEPFLFPFPIFLLRSGTGRGTGTNRFCSTSLVTIRLYKEELKKAENMIGKRLSRSRRRFFDLLLKEVTETLMLSSDPIERGRQIEEEMGSFSNTWAIYPWIYAIRANPEGRI
jgi:hypothetical protein